ncbi:MAG: ion transporter [Sandaracinaceae bacterium]|nr:ion transporter [Sandaracinaceae bacterium]
MRPSQEETSLRARVERAIEHPLTETVVALLIALSVGLLLFEASLEAGSPQRDVVAIANDVVTWIFVVELALRFWVEKRKRRFFRRYWIDILAVLPLLRAFRMLRVLRLLRLFRLGATLTQHARQYSSALAYVKQEYFFGALIVVVVVLMGAFSIRFAESRDTEGFEDFEHSFWYAVMTVAANEPTLATPQTRLGRMVTLALMLGGMTLFAFFTGTVSAVMIDSLRKLRYRRMELEELEGHVVVCGWNNAGKEFIAELLLHSSHKRQVVIITESEELDETLLGDHTHQAHVLRGDFTKSTVLRKAGIERAAFAVILADTSRTERTTQDRDARTVLAAMLVEKLNANIHTTVQLLDAENEGSLRDAGVEDIIVADAYVGGMMANVVKNRGMVPVISEILTARHGQQLFKVPAPAAIVGMTVADAMAYLKEQDDATLLAVAEKKPKRREGARHEESFVVNPPADLVIRDDHEVVVTAQKKPAP